MAIEYTDVETRSDGVRAPDVDDVLHERAKGEVGVHGDRGGDAARLLSEPREPEVAVSHDRVPGAHTDVLTHGHRRPTVPVLQVLREPGQQLRIRQVDARVAAERQYRRVPPQSVGRIADQRHAGGAHSVLACSRLDVERAGGTLAAACLGVKGGGETHHSEKGSGATHATSV